MILKNATVLNSCFEPVRADLATSGERIAEIAPDLQGRMNTGGEAVDLSGCTLVPGFVDIHIHASIGVDTCDASREGLKRVAAYLATKGVTSFCPTTMTVSSEEIRAARDNVRDCMEHPGPGARIAGVNMEGPYLSIHRKGAQKGEYIRTPDWRAFRDYYEGCGGIIKLLDVAPECEGAEELIRNASRLCTVSIAHTEADFAQAKQSFAWGVTHATHLYNAMSGFNHRAPGVVGAVFDTPAVSAELICDGFHIDPAVLRITFRVLGEDRTVIISDAMRAAGMKDGDYDLGGQNVQVRGGLARLAGGTIAGSTTNMHQEVKNLLSYGVPFRQVIKSATINPARQIHEDHQTGSLEPGKYADIVALDENMDIRLVVCRGEIAFRA